MDPTKSEPTARRVFLSHSSKDNAVAAAVRRSLSDRGLEVWSSQDIKPGDNIAASIQREINEADDVVILMSPSSEVSPWMEYEAAAAVAAREIGERRKRVIPVLLEAGAQPPPILARFTYVDLSRPTNWPKELDRLARTVALDAPIPSAKDEERLEREHLAVERIVLDRAQLAHDARAARREGMLSLALDVVALASTVVLLALAVLGVFGQLSGVLAAVLGAATGAFLTYFIGARSR